MKIAIATNEPWGTYHLRPLLAHLATTNVDVLHVVPDLDRVPDGPRTALHVGPHLPADLDALVVSGFTDWPLRVAHDNPHLPLVASCLAYMNPTPARADAAVRDRLTTITAASPADAAAFAGHLNVDASRVQVVGAPVLDTTVEPTRTGHTLVLTSVTAADATGAAAAANTTLHAAATALRDAGQAVVVRLHPRESPAVWDGFDLDASETARAAAAGARMVVAVPGTACAEIAADRTPIVAVTHPDQFVPTHLLDLCPTTLTATTDVHAWLKHGAHAELPSTAQVAAAVGPVGGAAQRLLHAWTTVRS